MHASKVSNMEHEGVERLHIFTTVYVIQWSPTLGTITSPLSDVVDGGLGTTLHALDGVDYALPNVLAFYGVTECLTDWG